MVPDGLLALMNDDSLREWMGLFHRATGLAIRLLPPGLDFRPTTRCGHEHEFCERAGVKGSAVCDKTRGALRRKLAAKLVPHQIVCDTGMAEVAVPIVVGEKHVGTFLVGQAFLKKPDARSWARLAASMSDAKSKKRLQPLRAAYLNGGVVPDETLNLLIHMVTLHSHRLAGKVSNGKKPRAAKLIKRRSPRSA